jgi:hypothetical protein
MTDMEHLTCFVANADTITGDSFSFGVLEYTTRIAPTTVKVGLHAKIPAR